MVGVPRELAYERWADYDRWAEMFKNEPANAGTKVQVSSKIGPVRRTWEAEVQQAVPGRRIAWKAGGGVNAEGTTTFHSLDDNLTEVMVEMEYDPSGMLEAIGNLLRVQRRRVRRDLKLFKNYVELHGDRPGHEGGRGAGIAKSEGRSDGEREED